jgi:hypothetical protein
MSQDSSATVADWLTTGKVYPIVASLRMWCVGRDSRLSKYIFAPRMEKPIKRALFDSFSSVFIAKH